jgi:hypothetical protein
MTILVEIDSQAGQRTGDWIVRNGSRGRILSRHRTKSAAVSQGRTEARKRGTNLKIQGTDGQWSQGPSYGGR